MTVGILGPAELATAEDPAVACDHVVVAIDEGRYGEAVEGLDHSRGCDLRLRWFAMARCFGVSGSGFADRQYPAVEEFMSGVSSVLPPR